MRKKVTTTQNAIPADAVLVIPEPEQPGDAPLYGVKPGYYNAQEMIQLLEAHKSNSDAVHYIADMLETGDAETDGFAHLLRDNSANPSALAAIIKTCKEES